MKPESAGSTAVSGNLQSASLKKQLGWVLSMSHQTHNRHRFKGIAEFAESFAPRPGTSYVLFDFDGTLSLLREGWPEVMVPMFAESLPARPNETESARWQ